MSPAGSSATKTMPDGGQGGGSSLGPRIVSQSHERCVVSHHETTDATCVGSEELLRAWYHWFRTAADVPAHLPENLHVQTAAYLAARAVEDGRKIYGPHSL